MNDIEVGDYVRTKQGEIAKIVDTNMFDKTIYKDKQGVKYYLEEIVNHSKNIIDLIEVGDYVNGCLVVKHSYKPELYVSYVYVGGKVQTTIEDYTNKLEDIEIQTIVTKEQFQAIEYKIGG